MPTAPSWVRPGPGASAAVVDVAALLRFRLAGLRGRSRVAAPVALLVLLALTVAAATLPALLPEYRIDRRDVLGLLPTACLGVLVVSVLSAVASGGGRELLPREQAVAFPVSPTTDHLGALLMAPLNIAWLLQAWALLAGTAYAVGLGAPSGSPALPPVLLAALLPPLLWLVGATTVGLAAAWAVEWVRRGARGVLVVRLGTALLASGVAVLVGTGTLAPTAAASPTRYVVRGIGWAAAGRWVPWLALVVVLVAGTVLVGGLGARLAGAVARRPAREEVQGETAVRPARPHPGSDLLALVRTDRAGIWRSVPMRRGTVVLALFPGLVAVAGSFRWEQLGVFPGLVASGGALLFGVNSWCLDGRGALWRESLPVRPSLVLAARALALTEILLAATVVTLVLASVRAGLPTGSEVAAVGCATVVVVVQVVATALHWSVRSPYAVDLRSARATPAPPLVMVGYSARLAVGTTVTGLLLTSLTDVGWGWPLLIAMPFLTWSGLRLRRTARAWNDPVTRSRVVATVSG